MEPPIAKKSNRILFLSSYPPRKCGIATFTQDLSSAFNKKFNPVVKTEICALNDHIYNYNSNVIYQINASDIENYVSLAQKINLRNDIKLINIQHEFGLFGGRYGDYLIPFLQTLEKPAITTFHSVISKPDVNLKKVVKAITAKCKTIVVMNILSQKILENDYEIPQSKINYIPHGIPQVTYESSKEYKKDLGYEGKIVLSTFGFVSKNKGIEYAIRALPKIIRKFPNVIYLIIGETHPNIQNEQGEKYRNFLYREIDKLGLKNNVKFFNKYMILEELIRFLQATDIYICPCVDKKQSVSGTLSYALGCGKAVISTKTEYAKHIINKENGILVSSKNSEEITKGILRLISDEKTSKAMAAQSYKDTRPMIWPNVAQSYLKLYKKFAKLEIEENKLPEIKFDHVVKMTDDFGIIQHANYNNPNKRFGYSLDDVSRALIACAMYYRDNPSDQLKKLMETYIRFIEFAKRKDKSFANIISYKRKKDNILEEDVQGRIIWALGYILAQDYLPKEIKDESLELFQSSVSLFPKIKAPRSIAFTMLGLYFYLKTFSRDNKLKKIFQDFSGQLVEFYKNNACSDWRWFEKGLTYSNSKLPEALFCAYDLLKDKTYLKTAKSSLDFLESITLGSEYYIPIGQKGWYFKNKQRSYFDQQPEDTASMVQTKIVAYKITRDKKHLKEALRIFHWFLGKNYLGLMVYDEATGGCNDGLGEHELNLNQGAESTISYLMARLSFEDQKINNIIKTL
ncbi:glycosyltransferase [Patescibacteria group bacterium]|nr:glycosyltransferase [Patescibacteria group bacterium]